jgi:hypothetical protein
MKAEERAFYGLICARTLVAFMDKTLRKAEKLVGHDVSQSRPVVGTHKVSTDVVEEVCEAMGRTFPRELGDLTLLREERGDGYSDLTMNVLCKKGGRELAAAWKEAIGCA